MIGTEVVHRSDARRGAVWHAVFAEEAPDLALVDWSPERAAAARYLVAWTPPENPGRAMPQLDVPFNLGAGADHLAWAEVSGSVTVDRMVDPELTRSIVEHVFPVILAQHRDLPAYLEAQRAGVWQARPVRRAVDPIVGILGVLGTVVAGALTGLGLPVWGWSASPNTLPRIATFAGRDALPQFLSGVRSLVRLLPLTGATRGLLDAGLIGAQPAGAGFVNVGRGGRVVDADFAAALDAGHLSSAVLRRFGERTASSRPSALDCDASPRQHDASRHRGATGDRGGERHRWGLPMAHVVDRARGY